MGCKGILFDGGVGIPCGSKLYIFAIYFELRIPT